MRQYIGARYVPTFADPLTWDNSHSYEALIMVDYMGDTYTSKKPVPPGIAITDTEYWVMTGSFNSQLSEIRTDLSDLTDNLPYPYAKRIILIGDSFVQGVGGNGLDIENEIKSLSNYYVKSYYQGGAGYIRENTSNKKIIDAVNDAIAGENEPESITDVVLAVSLYNDSGASGQADFNEAGFAYEMSNINSAVKSGFKNAKIHVCSLWNSGSIGTNLFKISKWTMNAARSIGADYSKDSVVWLTPYDNVTAGDDVHLNNAGYKIVAEDILCMINGTKPSSYDVYGTINTATGQYLNYTIKDGNIHLYGSFTRQSGQTFTQLCTLPSAFKMNVNIPLYVKKYSSQNPSDDVSALIVGSYIYLGSSQLTSGELYIIDWYGQLSPSI